MDDGSRVFSCTTENCVYGHTNYWAVNAHRSSHSPRRAKDTEPGERRVQSFNEAAAIIRGRIAEIEERDDLILQQSRTIDELTAELERYRRFVK